MLLVLDHVIYDSSPLVSCIIDTLSHVLSCLKIVQILLEPRLEVGQADWLEAWEARVEHQLCQVEKLVCVPSDC